ncbi:MAG: Gfo/Idh/MocA family oxidoreductase [Opitutaceae bacterium]|jgi:predicted dehydrogenase|nr:Gfo/Idh/MocA family oxidoreductase [Opitutaceae bacterium]
MSKIRLAILGTGGMAAQHAERFLKNSDVLIVALGDVSTEVMERFKVETGLDALEPAPEMFTDAATMFAQAELDAVIIVTPHTLHFDHAMLAADAGLHVFMEKPMVTSSEQAHALAERFRDLKKVFIVGYNTPCTPEFQFLRQTIRDQSLGKLELISGYLSQDWMNLTEGTWRQQPELSGGGQAYDSGAHLLNSLCWSVESDIAEVFTFLDNRGTPVDVNSSINLRFTNGVMASVVVSGNCATDGADLHFMFERGRIDIDGWEGQWLKVWDGEARVENPAIFGMSQTPNDNFIDAILGRAEPRTSIQNGIVQSELMDAIYESAKTGLPAKPR